MQLDYRFFSICWLAIGLFLTTTGASAQSAKYTVSGTIRDAKTGESLIGATAYAKAANASSGAAANAYGFYSITVPAGQYAITYQFIGYKPKTVPVSLDANKQLDVELDPESQELDEVVVKGEKADDQVTRNQMGVEKLNIESIKNIPVLFGERDVLKTIQLLPGVKAAGEGNSGFFVRGGAADQNLILLDEATVYNASHLLGFFSVFNSDALKDATLYKGGMPAEYGGRLSSVLDIKMKEGNSKKYNITGGIGLIASRLTVEGPLNKGRGSFIVSGRRTYADLFLKLSSDSVVNRSSLYFYDLNAKANYKLNERNWLYASGYFGTDQLGLRNVFGIEWGNATGTLRWNHLFNNRLFLNSSLVYSNYRYNIILGSGNTKTTITSRIKNWNLKEDFEYYANDRNTLKFGVNFIYHILQPGNSTTSENSGIGLINLTEKYAAETGWYASHEYKFSDRLTAKYGARLSTFTNIGPGTYYTFNADRSVARTDQYKEGDVIRTYTNLQPRASLTYLLTPESSVKMAYDRNVQYLHLLSNSNSGNPTDLWIPSSNNVKPQTSDMLSLGYFRNLANNRYELSVETYYKDLQNQIDYRAGAQTLANEFVEADLVYGKGRAYGVELSLKKKTGDFTGWISYTLSRTERQFDAINSGAWFAARQDRTHDISVVGTYQLSPKWVLSGNFVYYTGNAVTFPTGKYFVDGQLVSNYSERNSYRMPAYHRLDLSATWYRRRTATTERSWNFSLYNAYGRENPYTITFRQNKDNPAQTEAVQATLFRWIPSVTYNFKF